MSRNAGDTSRGMAGLANSGPTKITVEVLQQQARLAALREVQGMVSDILHSSTPPVNEGPMIRNGLDAMIAKEERTR